MIEAFRLGGESTHFLSVQMLDRPWASQADYWDGNMVQCQIELALGLISARFKEVLWLPAFLSFADEIQAMHESLRGSASFESISHAISLKLEMGSLGQVRASGEVCPSFLPLQKVVFDLGESIDQTHLGAIQGQLREALEAMPIIKR